MNQKDYLGSVLAVGQPYVSPGYEYCGGQLLPMVDNTAYFAIVADFYGGDGRVTVGVPDLRRRVPLGAGEAPDLSSYFLGQMDGVSEAVFEPSADNMPVHSHTAEFDAASLDAAATTTADVSGSLLEGSISCSDGQGGEANPVDHFPGTSPSAGVNPWSDTHTGTMWPDAIVSGTLVGGATVTTTFFDMAISVTTNNAGESQKSFVPTSLPAQGILYVICTDGIWPPRPK